MDTVSTKPHRNKWLKVVLWIFAILITIPIFIVLLFQLSPVQNFAKSKVESFLRNKFHTSVMIGQLRLTWWNSLSIKKLYLGDKNDQALLYSGSLDVSFNLLQLINNQLVVKKLEWDDLVVNVYRLPGDTTYNYQFIIDAFSSGKEKDTITSTGTTMNFSIGNVSLTNAYLRFMDAPAGMATNIKFKSLLIKPDEIKPERSLYDLDELEIEGLTGVINRRYIAQPLIAKQVEEEVEKADTAAMPLLIKAGILSIKNSGVWYNDEASGLNTNWQIKDLGINDASFDPAKNTISANEIKIHRTNGALAMQKGKDTITTVIATDTTVSTAWIIKVKNLDVDNLGFKYDKLDVARHSNKSQIDFNHLDVNSIRVQAQNLNYNTDSILVNLNELTLKDRSGFEIEEGHADLLYTDKIVALRNLLIKTGKSRIASEVIAEAPSIKTVSDNLNELLVKATLENTYVDMQEISQLVPSLKNNPSLKPILRKIISANGNVSGSMARLKINELNVTDNDGSKLRVTGIIQNASDPDKLIAILEHVDIQSGERSIKSWLPVGTIPDSISIPSSLHLFGSATYSKNEVLAKLRLNSSMGDMILNGKASQYMDAKYSRYNVAVPLLRMDIGRLLQDTMLGKVDISFIAKGNGYDYKTLTADVELQVKEAFYNNYRFHAINSVASLDKGNFNLFLQSKDSNALATVQLDGLLDSLKSKIAGSVELERLDLYATKLSATPMATKGNMLLDIKNLEPRHLNGSVMLTGIQFADDSTIYALDTLNLLASDTINQQQIAVTGPFGFITANGDYDYTKAFIDLSAMVQQHLTSIDSSKNFASKESQIMDLNAALIWPGSLKSLAPGIEMEQPLTINGRLNTDSSLLNLSFLLAQAKYNDFSIDTIRGLINSDANKLASNIYLSKLMHPQFPLEKTTIDIVAQNGTLETDIDLLDNNERQKYALGAIIKFLPANALSFALKPKLILNKTPWVVSDSNNVMMSDGALRSADLAISSAGQSVSVKTVSKNTNATPDLEIKLNQFRLSTITALLEKDSLLAEGIATGKATISNYDQSPLINAQLVVDSIKVMKTPLGTLSVDANTPTTGQYDVNAKLAGNGNDVTVDGTYAEELNFNVNLNKLNMASIEPLTMGAVSRMSGATSGQFTLKGTPADPQIRGRLNFDTVAANITALGNYLKLNKENLVFDEKGISFNNFVIADSLNNKAVIDGEILTKDYKDYRFQLDVKADNFMVAGPQQSPDQMLYGPAFVDADAKIRGSLDVPRIDVKLLLRDSSKFTVVIPDSEPGIAEREGVIVFVDRDNQLDSSLLRLTSRADSTIAKGASGGISLNAQVEVTPSSTLRVIIDQQNGDYLEVKGKANLDASMTPSSELSMTGRYEINEGSYNMSLNNLIKRKFAIEKGSTITLQGPVENALVDITARYRVEAVAGDLVEDQLTGASDTKRTQFKQRVPVDVYLQIKNELLKPEISFRLDMPERERNALNGVVYNRIKQINEVESELNKQVMGLLVLNSFIPENPLALVNDRGGSGVEGTARKSVSKLISQQLNNFAGSLIKGFDVNFDLESQDDYSTGKEQTSTNLNVGVSKSLFKDRVSVSVGSSVNLEGPQQAQQASSLIGDVSVDYKITPDGRYRLRAYRQNETDAIVEGQIIETGASFIYVIDYDEFRELFQSKKKVEEKKNTRKKGK